MKQQDSEAGKERRWGERGWCQGERTSKTEKRIVKHEEGSEHVINMHK